MPVVEKYYDEDGRVAVLISGGYGAGWSTWAHEHEIFMLHDKGLVEMALRNASEEEVIKYLKATIAEGDEERIPYTGGWEDGIHVEFLEKGTEFSVDEYDGAESLTTIASLEYRA